MSTSLDRLRKELYTPPPGRKAEVRVVRAKDLAELLYQFDRLDAEARARHLAESKRK